MPLDPQRVQSLFLAAVKARTPTARAVLLDGECGTDAELRQRVEALLRAHEASDSFLERIEALLHPPDGSDSFPDESSHASVSTVDDPMCERPGTVIGLYKLLEQIGEGGFGDVFLAEQQTPIRRKVALKVLKPGMDTRQVVARFEAERQALALMDHPNIAHIFDGGATVAGRPFFVMELVSGVPITDFCDQNCRSIRERLELFVDVCQAVQHAHQKGIIHRDIKPSNVMVTLHDGTPVVKVIDFGIAKATSQQLTDKTLFTQFAQMIGSPLYMSPEQAGQSGLDVDTRSDIYSLGVLLYELLTGTTPFERERLRSADYEEIRRIIREEEPPRPSTRIHTLGEGATTVSTQRRSEPKRLSRMLRGELDWIIMRALEKDRNRRYETASAFAADVQRYLHDEPVLACPPSAGYRLRKFARRHKTGLAVAVLVLLFLASLGGVAGWAALQQAKQQAVQRAALEADIGRDLDEARAFCRQDRLREASTVLDHAQTLAAREGADAELGGRVAQVRTDVDMATRLEVIRLERAAVKDEHFDFEGTALRYAEAFRDYRLDVDHLDPEDAAERIKVSAIREQLIAALDDWLLTTSSRNRERLLAVLAGADADPWRQQLRAVFVNRNLQALRDLARETNATAQPPADAVLLGRALSELGETGLAVEFLRRARQEHPSDFWLNQDLGHSLVHHKSARAGEAVGYLRVASALRPDSPGVLVNLGKALHADGDLLGAIAAFQKAIDYKSDYAMAHNNLGVALRDKGQLDEAITEFREAIRLRKDWAEAHSNLGGALTMKGQLDEAITECREAIRLNKDFAFAHNNLGVALRDKGQLDEAIAECREAIRLDKDFASAHCNLGNALQEKGQLDKAIAEYREAIRLKEGLAEAYSNLGVALTTKGRLDEAIAECRKAIRLQKDDAVAHNSLGNALYAKGRLNEAITEYREAIRLKKDYAKAHYHLANALWDKGQLDEAIAEYREAIRHKSDFAEAHNSLGGALAMKGQLDEAIAECREAIRIKKDDPIAHLNLGTVLYDKGQLDEAIAEYREAVRLKKDWAVAHNSLKNALATRDTLAKLPAILSGKVKIANTAECLTLAMLCQQHKQWHAASVRFYSEAFAKEPKLADDLNMKHRYNAACAAALAGCGQGQDADKLKDKERIRLRRQALDWLRADLNAWGRLLNEEPDKSRPLIVRQMQHWLADADFVGVRGPQALAKLPETEREPWQKLWDAVTALRNRAQGKTASERKKG